MLNLLAIANKIAKKNVSFHYFENFKDNDDIPEDFKQLIKDIKINLSLNENAQKDIDKIKESGVVL